MSEDLKQDNSEDLKHDFIHKIVVIGDGAVGKTSLIQRFTQGSFNKEYIKTLGAQFSSYERMMGDNNDIRARLFFWDIAGQKEFVKNVDPFNFFWKISLQIMEDAIEVGANHRTSFPRKVANPENQE